MEWWNGIVACVVDTAVVSTGNEWCTYAHAHFPLLLFSMEERNTYSSALLAKILNHVTYTEPCNQGSEGSQG